MARFFKKLYSSQKETIEDDFLELDDEKVGDTLGVKFINTFKHSHGTLVKVTAHKHPSAKSVEGTIEPEIKCDDYIVKAKLQTSNKFEATISAVDKLTKGATAFITGKCELGPETSKNTVDVGVDYLNKDYGSLNLKFSTPITLETSSMELYGAFVGHTQGASIGADVIARVGSQEVTKTNGYVQYDDKEKSIAVWGKFDKKKGYKTGLGLYYQQNDNLKYGFEASFDPKDKDSNQIRAGGVKKFDNNFSMKGRLTITNLEEFRAGLVFKLALSPDSKVTLASDINANTLLNLKSSKKALGLGHQFGLSLSFFD